MEMIAIAVLIGLLPAYIARSKGRSFGLWWLYGAMIFIVALPHALLMKKDDKSLEQEQLRSGGMKKCPHCAELVKTEATVCRFCNREFATKKQGVET